MPTSPHKVALRHVVSSLNFLFSNIYFIVRLLYPLHLTSNNFNAVRIGTLLKTTFLYIASLFQLTIQTINLKCNFQSKVLQGTSSTRYFVTKKKVLLKFVSRYFWRCIAGRIYERLPLAFPSSVIFISSVH